MSEDFKFIFVGGCGRSGTTLVQKILAAHSKIVGGPEFDHAKDLFKAYQAMSSPDHLIRQSFYYDKNTLINSFQSFYKSFFSKLLTKKEKITYISEKTPTNIDVADSLLEVFPDAVFINVFRDGRDVMISHIDVKNRYALQGLPVRPEDYGVRRISSIWNASIDKFLKMSQHPYFSRRFFSIRYEELVANPNSVLPKLFDFLQLEIEPQLFSPETFTAQQAGVDIDNIWYTQEMYHQGFNTSKIGRWQKELSMMDRVLCNILMADNLMNLDYDVESYAKGEIMDCIAALHAAGRIDEAKILEYLLKHFE
jgi:protein-tyrosine sulfotransferase